MTHPLSNRPQEDQQGHCVCDTVVPVWLRACVNQIVNRQSWGHQQWHTLHLHRGPYHLQHRAQLEYSEVSSGDTSCSQASSPPLPTPPLLSFPLLSSSPLSSTSPTFSSPSPFPSPVLSSHLLLFVCACMHVWKESNWFWSLEQAKYNLCAIAYRYILLPSQTGELTI